MMGNRAASRLVMVSGMSEAFWRREERCGLSRVVVLASKGWTLVRIWCPNIPFTAFPLSALVHLGALGVPIFC